MELRISVSESGRFSAVKVDGSLTVEGLAELGKVVTPCAGALRLDLSDLRSLDDQAVTAIQTLVAKGAEIVGASPYIALLIGVAVGRQRKRRKREEVP